MSLTERWSQTLDNLKAQGRLRSFNLPQGIDLTSNDYLGYGGGRQVPGFEEQISHSQLPRTGMSSRLLRGHHAVWEEVESALAAWHGAESVLMMTSGYAANEGLISTLFEPADWVASDELNHACIIDGLRLARCRRFSFRHNDLNHLEEGLKAEAAKRGEGREMFVVTESLFSMDGDRAPLPAIVRLAERYGAQVIVDEAHSTGCFGPSGSGCVDESGVRSRILASVHTGGKALGVPGAYICGPRLLKDYLVNRCRHLIFTTAPPPACGAWWLEMLPKVQADQRGRSALHEAAAFFRSALARHGIQALGDQYIAPIVIGEDAPAVRAARALQESGYDVRAIRPPSVPPGTSRLRLSIHADHRLEMLGQVAQIIARECQAAVN
jgi:8-amino-7-oxononanoate synthase